VSRRRRYRMATVDGRRVRVVRFRGVRGHVVRWTDDCSGCTEIGDYGTRFGPFGCSECGHTGKRRCSAWVPLNPRDYDKAFPSDVNSGSATAPPSPPHGDQ